MAHRLLNPPDLSKPPGFSHGAVGSGQTLYVSGQVGNDATGGLVSDDLVEQFDRALGNVITVVRAAGGAVEDIVKINLLVVDTREYTAKGNRVHKKISIGQHDYLCQRQSHRRGLSETHGPPLPGHDPSRGERPV